MSIREAIAGPVDLRTAEPCCAPLAAQRIPGDVAQVMAVAFKAIGDPVRLQLLSMIASSPTGESCVCEMTPAFSLSGPTISHHLRVLRQAALVTADRRGTLVYYRVNRDVVRQLAGVLALPPTK